MENIVQSLEHLGLTKYEAKTYSALLILGKSTATEISAQSQVPRARIYDVLSTLARKNWIRIIEQKPVRYESCSLNEIKTKLRKIEEGFRKAKKDVVEELNSYVNHNNELVSENSVELVLGENKTFKELSSSIDLAQKQIFLFHFKEDILLKLLPYLKNAKKRGLTIKILVSPDISITTKRILKKEFGAKTYNKKVENGSFLVDNKKYMNVFFNKLNADKINYKRCIYCILAWLNREWEEGKKI